MKISAKEADEVEYFLKLCKESNHYPFKQELLDKVQIIIKDYFKFKKLNHKYYIMEFSN